MLFSWVSTLLSILLRLILRTIGFGCFKNWSKISKHDLMSFCDISEKLDKIHFQGHLITAPPIKEKKNHLLLSNYLQQKRFLKGWSLNWYWKLHPILWLLLVDGSRSVFRRFFPLTNCTWRNYIVESSQYCSSEMKIRQNGPNLDTDFWIVYPNWPYHRRSILKRK